MTTYEAYRAKYPLREATIHGARFPYRHHQHPTAGRTVVLLTGAIGLSDLLLAHFDALAADYSVLTFDYPAAYATNRHLVDAIAALLQRLGIRAIVVGQSYGGFVTQMLAQAHPQVVEGLILSNTGTLSVALDARSEKSLRAMLGRVNALLGLTRIAPFCLAKRIVAGIFSKKTGMAAYWDEVARSLTRRHTIHMLHLLKDLEPHWNMRPDDFAHLQGRVLLILCDDDATFGIGVRQALIDLMPDPQIVADICGGHMALWRSQDAYLGVMRAFVDGDV